MSHDPISQQPTEAPPPPPASNRGCSCFLGACLGVLVVCVLLCGGGVLAVWLFGDQLWELSKGPIVDAASRAAKQAVEDSQLSPEDKQVVREQIGRVAEAYKKGELTNEQMARIMQNLADSPLFVVAMVFAVEQKYVVPSGLSAEEKDQAHRTLERTARGLYEKSIDQNRLDTALAYISNKKPDGSYELKQHVTDEELRAFLAECKKAADQAQIPDEPFEVNFGAEVKQAVDAELGE